MENISNKIQAELKRTGKKQQDLAKFMKMHTTQLSRKLSRGTFNLDDMIKISQFLGVDINVLSSGSNSKSIQKSTQEVDNPESNEVRFLLGTIEALKEALRAKDEIIATLKEKKT